MVYNGFWMRILDWMVLSFEFLPKGSKKKSKIAYQYFRQNNNVFLKEMLQNHQNEQLLGRLNQNNGCDNDLKHTKLNLFKAHLFLKFLNALLKTQLYN